MITYYSLTDGANINEYRHSIAVRSIFPSPSGTRCVVVDQSNNTFVYSPITDECISIPEIGSSKPIVKQVLWDVVDSNTFLCHDGATCYVNFYVHNSVSGSRVRRLAESYTVPEDSLLPEAEPGMDTFPVPSESNILLFYDGHIICQSGTGEMECLKLRTHNSLIPYDTHLLMKSFLQNVALDRLQAASALASQMDNRQAWEILSAHGLDSLEIEKAKDAIARIASEPGKVSSLEKLNRLESKQQISGAVYQFLGNFRKAQEIWVQSGVYGSDALQMHLALMNWNEVIPLAEAYAPYKLPVIFFNTAKQLEQAGQYQQAQGYFQKALIEGNINGQNDSMGPDIGGFDQKVKSHNVKVQSGLARTRLRCGDIHAGIQLAKEVNNQFLFKECAHLLEGVKHNYEAGQMYEKAEMYEKAAMLYIKDMNFDAAGHLLSRIKTPKLFTQYAKAKESRQQFAEALDAYERAKDYDAVVRLLLNNLNRADEAFNLVRQKRLQQGAELIAEYSRKKGDMKSAIEFLLICANRQEAFHLASTHDEMEIFQEIFKQISSTESSTGDIQEYYEKIAKYYEGRSLLGKAAMHYANCGKYEISLKLYLKSGNEEDLLKAIDVVGKAHDERLTQKLEAYLQGDTSVFGDSSSRTAAPKDKQFLYKLYKALGNYEKAASTAMVISKTEQDKGNYKVVHDLLYHTFQDLQKQGLPVPLDLYKKLVLLHSYVIVKRIVKGGDHQNAAQMLLRVATNIQQFPEHIVPILTSVVIECQRANLKDDAHQYAVMLMRPEYRSMIAEQYKRKIEAIVRKKQATDEATPTIENVPCPHCSSLIPKNAVDCSHCLNILPLCIYTGLFVPVEDFSYCPSCRFAAKFSEITKNANDPCPMCNAPIVSNALEHLRDSNIQGYLDGFLNQFKQVKRLVYNTIT